MAELMTQFMEEVTTWPGFKSDHLLISLDIVYSLNTRGPGYWKFNNSLLKDPEFLKAINNLLDIELAQENLYSSVRQLSPILL